MRAALYIRVSTEEQAKEGISLEAQKAILDRKSAEFGYTIMNHYVDDGYSAKNLKRPALQQLIADAERKQFDVILFWRLDRLTRSSKDFHRLTEQLQKNSVGLKSINDPIDTTSAIGRFQLELSVSLAQLERETISERVHFVMEENARKGTRNGSFAPYGYDLDNKKLVVNNDQADVVRRIFDLYLEGTGMKSIAHMLVREGIPSPSEKSLWSAPGIKYFLENPVYIGKLRYNYQSKTKNNVNNEIITDAEHESIIDELTFERVQTEIKRRAKGGKKFTNTYLFSSTLKCGRCGGTMQGASYTHSNKRYRTYRCGNKFDHGTCDFHNISENAVVDAFLRALDLNDVEFEKYFKGPDSEKEERDRVESIQRELEAITHRKKRWQVAYANEVITLEELKEHTNEDRTREEFLKLQLKNTTAETKTFWSKEELITQLKQLRLTWHLIDNDKAKKLFVQEAFESITIYTDPNSKVGQGARIKVNVIDLKFRT